MKTERNRLERIIEEVNEGSIEYLRSEFIAILESDMDYTYKADKVAYSILSIESKIASIDVELKELQEIKKKLQTAKAIALTVAATVVENMGVKKIEGAGISSITVTKLTTKKYQTIEVHNDVALISAGYFLKEVDEDKILADYNNGYNKEFIKQHCKVQCKEVITLPRLKINKRRNIKQMEEVS